MGESTRYDSQTMMKALLVLYGFALVVFQPNFFLLLFAGVLFSVLLTHTSLRITGKLKLPYGLSLVLVHIAGFFTGFALFFGPSVVEQVNDMLGTLPQAMDRLGEKLAQTILGQKLLDVLPEYPRFFFEDKRAVLSRVAGSFSTTLGVLVNLLIVIITGIFLASAPATYKRGFMRLFPVPFRPRLGQVMDKTNDTLSWWMAAKLISMLVVRVSTAIGLWLLGVPLPYALAFMAGLFSFIPNIGPYLALAPALLIALVEGSDKALYVLILYYSIQIVESYLPRFWKRRWWPSHRHPPLCGWCWSAPSPAYYS